jgi:hypothetical protein
LFLAFALVSAGAAVVPLAETTILGLGESETALSAGLDKVGALERKADDATDAAMKAVETALEVGHEALAPLSAAFDQGAFLHQRSAALRDKIAKMHDMDKAEKRKDVAAIQEAQRQMDRLTKFEPWKDKRKDKRRQKEPSTGDEFLGEAQGFRVGLSAGSEGEVSPVFDELPSKLENKGDLGEVLWSSTMEEVPTEAVVPTTATNTTAFEPTNAEAANMIEQNKIEAQSILDEAQRVVGSGELTEEQQKATLEQAQEEAEALTARAVTEANDLENNAIAAQASYVRSGVLPANATLPLKPADTEDDTTPVSDEMSNEAVNEALLRGAESGAKAGAREGAKAGAIAGVAAAANHLGADEQKVDEAAKAAERASTVETAGVIKAISGPGGIRKHIAAAINVMSHNMRNTAAPSDAQAVADAAADAAEEAKEDAAEASSAKDAADAAAAKAVVEAQVAENAQAYNDAQSALNADSQAASAAQAAGEAKLQARAAAAQAEGAKASAKLKKENADEKAKSGEPDDIAAARVAADEYASASANLQQANAAAAKADEDLEQANEAAREAEAAAAAAATPEAAAGAAAAAVNGTGNLEVMMQAVQNATVQGKAEEVTMHFDPLTAAEEAAAQRNLEQKIDTASAAITGLGINKAIPQIRAVAEAAALPAAKKALSATQHGENSMYTEHELQVIAERAAEHASIEAVQAAGVGADAGMDVNQQVIIETVAIEAAEESMKNGMPDHVDSPPGTPHTQSSATTESKEPANLPAEIAAHSELPEVKAAQTARDSVVVATTVLNDATTAAQAAKTKADAAAQKLENAQGRAANATQAAAQAAAVKVQLDADAVIDKADADVAKEAHEKSHAAEQEARDAHQEAEDAAFEKEAAEIAEGKAAKAMEAADAEHKAVSLLADATTEHAENAVAAIDMNGVSVIGGRYRADNISKANLTNAESLMLKKAAAELLHSEAVEYSDEADVKHAHAAATAEDADHKKSETAAEVHALETVESEEAQAEADAHTARDTALETQAFAAQVQKDIRDAQITKAAADAEVAETTAAATEAAALKTAADAKVAGSVEAAEEAVAAGQAAKDSEAFATQAIADANAATAKQIADNEAEHTTNQATVSMAQQLHDMVHIDSITSTTTAAQIRAKGMDVDTKLKAAEEAAATPEEKAKVESLRGQFEAQYRAHVQALVTAAQSVAQRDEEKSKVAELQALLDSAGEVSAYSTQVANPGNDAGYPPAASSDGIAAIPSNPTSAKLDADATILDAEATREAEAAQLAKVTADDQAAEAKRDLVDTPTNLNPVAVVSAEAAAASSQLEARRNDVDQAIAKAEVAAGSEEEKQQVRELKELVEMAATVHESIMEAEQTAETEEEIAKVTQLKQELHAKLSAALETPVLNKVSPSGLATEKAEVEAKLSAAEAAAKTDDERAQVEQLRIAYEAKNTGTVSVSRIRQEVRQLGEDARSLSRPHGSTGTPQHAVLGRITHLLASNAATAEQIADEEAEHTTNHATVSVVQQEGQPPQRHHRETMLVDRLLVERSLGDTKDNADPSKEKRALRRYEVESRLARDPAQIASDTKKRMTFARPIETKEDHERFLQERKAFADETHATIVAARLGPLDIDAAAEALRALEGQKVQNVMKAEALEQDKFRLQHEKGIQRARKANAANVAKVVRKEAATTSPAKVKLAKEKAEVEKLASGLNALHKHEAKMEARTKDEKKARDVSKDEKEERAPSAKTVEMKKAAEIERDSNKKTQHQDPATHVQSKKLSIVQREVNELNAAAAELTALTSHGEQTKGVDAEREDSKTLPAVGGQQKTVEVSKQKKSSSWGWFDRHPFA